MEDGVGCVIYVMNGGCGGEYQLRRIVRNDADEMGKQGGGATEHSAGGYMRRHLWEDAGRPGNWEFSWRLYEETSVGGCREDWQLGIQLVAT